MTTTINEAADGLPDVRDAFAGKRILLTGATGFVAKVLLEKLIRTVPDVGRIVLLIRAGSHGDARARFEREVAASSVFDHLRAVRPAWLERFLAERVDCVTGEITAPGFGFAPARCAELARGVDVVVNAAASVDFREPLDEALAINTLSLRHVTAFARVASAPLVHVSTCYVNGHNRGEMREDVVAPAGSARDGIPRHRDGWYDVDALIASLQRKIERVRAKADGADPERLRRRLTDLGIAQAQRHGWNDTYTFTKWLGEQVALRAMHGHALTIVRPSIIESTLREPAPGWIEGVKVADAVILAYARGKTSFFPARREGIIDVIPVDLVANAIVLAGAEALSAGPGRRIYQCCSGSTNPLALGELIRLLQAESKRNWRKYDRLFHAEPKHDFRTVGEGTFRFFMGAFGIGATAWNGLRRLAGAPGALHALDKLRTTRLLALTFAFYAHPRYRFHNASLLALAARFGEEARRLYPVDARLVDWEDYLCRIHMAGLNRYALRRRDAVPEEPAAAAAAAAAAPAAGVDPLAAPASR
ncbi:dehydrogenase [Massilia sp. Root133]|uniref:fatty acyl-CoA reductase n=1 Tax=unclassified Massilia TaxID=2609279 RepID=UPI0007000E40|nr:MULTISPECIES: fatty acyl-CoA reductase [unclassified Massilia]KQY15904.1 dehydrogenase [Massilia sp. Root133]KQZ44633.1 dehydrogenase [Massilia sp. Root1485]